MAIPGLPGTVVSQGEAELIRRIEAIERWQREALPSVAASFAPVIADLQAQAADVADVVADLGVEVARINTLVGEQVVGRAASAYTATPIGVSAGNTYTNATITVPSGYTRAVISGITSVTTSGTNPLIQVQTNINGSLGFAMPIYANDDSMQSGGCSHAVELTGLTAGGTITIGARVVALTGVTNAYFINTATATFYRS